MAKRIKITERQYRRMLNLDEFEFSYLTASEEEPNVGHKQINVSGNGESDINFTGDEETQLTADKLARIRFRADSLFNTRFRGNVIAHSMSLNEEGNADDLSELPTNNNQYLDKQSKLVKIPPTVKYRLKQLEDSIENSNLKMSNPNALATIGNELMKFLTDDKTNLPAQKNLTNTMLKNKGSNMSFGARQEIANND